MVTELEDAVAAPLEVEVGGKKMKLHPLVLNDYGEWDRWAKAQHLKAAAEAMEIMPAGQRSQNMRDAHVAATRIYWGSPHAMGVLLSISGRVQTAYLALRHFAPDLTADALWDMLSPGGKPDFAKLNELYVEALRMSGYESQDSDGAANPQDAVMAILNMV